MPAGTGQSEPDVTQIRELEQRLDNFRIEVSDNLTIRGSAWQGYALNVPACPEIAVVTPVGGCCDTETITITFSGIIMCPFLSGDLNGTFVLTSIGTGLWGGFGNDYFIPPNPDPFASRIEVACSAEGVPPRFFIDYNPDAPGSFAFFQFISTDIPPSFIDLANENTVEGCDVDKGSYDGTATITCGG